MKFCSTCGATVIKRVPAGDNRQRFVCGSCNEIHYQNPRIIVGCLPVYEDKVLLCKRGIEPRKNLWTVPAGFMENGETTVAGALRETWEEAEARIEGEVLYHLFDLPHINQVYFFYRGHLIDGKFGVGSESLETQLFSYQDIPWDELAFPIIKTLLNHYFSDLKNNEYPIRNLEADFFH